MQVTKDIPADLAPIIAAIRRREGQIRDLGVTALYVYGSRARGDHHGDSDLDIMVDYDPKQFSLFDMVGVQHIIGDETGLETHVSTRSSFRPANAHRYMNDLIEVL